MRWYLRFKLSLRDLVEMMAERGLSLVHTTIMRWMQRYAPGAERSVAVGRLADAQTAFAMTVHKSQGSEFEHTVLVLPPEGSRVLTREFVYTGITRAKRAFTLVTGRAAGFAQALGQQTRRSSGLPDLLPGAAVGA